MYGAMFGDLVGAPYEFDNIRTKDFPLVDIPKSRITDDSYMTIAVASACLNWPEHRDIGIFTEEVKSEMHRIGRNHIHAGYGGRFLQWLLSDDPRPYGSYGNGSAMRSSPCGFVAESLEEAELLAEASAMPTHNHPDGIAGAKAAAAAVYLAKAGCTKDAIRDYIHSEYYPLEGTVDEIRKTYKFEESCRGTVPPAVIAFLESTDFEDAIRNAVSIGGDSDTVAAITGAIAEAYYGGVTPYAREIVQSELVLFCDDEERDIASEFHRIYCNRA